MKFCLFFSLFLQTSFLFLDSEESVRREIPFFFKDFDVDQWMEYEEHGFRTGRPEYDPIAGIHKLEPFERAPESAERLAASLHQERW